MLTFISTCSALTALLAVLTLQWSLFATPVSVGPAFVICWGAMGAVWAVYAICVAPRLAARHGGVSLLRIPIFVVMLIGMNLLLDFIPGLSQNSASQPMPWLALWGSVWVLFLLVRWQRRRMLEREFLQLVGELPDGDTAAENQPNA